MVSRQSVNDCLLSIYQSVNVCRQCDREAAHHAVLDCGEDTRVRL